MLVVFDIFGQNYDLSARSPVKIAVVFCLNGRTGIKSSRYVLTRILWTLVGRAISRHNSHVIYRLPPAGGRFVYISDGLRRTPSLCADCGRVRLRTEIRSRERKCADTTDAGCSFPGWPFAMLKYKYLFQIRKHFYRTALGNCCGLKLPKC